MKDWHIGIGALLFFCVFGILAGWQESRKDEQQLSSFKAAGCKRTGFHPDDSRIALYTCPDGQVYKRLERM